jgi:hypothetical protein
VSLGSGKIARHASFHQFLALYDNWWKLAIDRQFVGCAALHHDVQERGAALLMGRYDIAFKHMFRSGGRAFLSVFGAGAGLKERDNEVSSVRERRVDFLAEIVPGHLLHLEFQSTPHRAMTVRMLGYWTDIVEKEVETQSHANAAGLIDDVKIDQWLIYTGSKPWKKPDGISNPRVSFDYGFLDMKDMDPEPLLTHGDSGDAVLALLCRNGAAPAMLRRILAKIANISSPVEKADAVARCLVVAQMRGVVKLVEQEVRDMGITVDMAESELLREPIDHAHKSGVAEGVERGRAEGRAEALVLMLKMKFGIDEIADGLDTHLADLRADILTDMMMSIPQAKSVEQVLGSHMPSPTHGLG